MRMKDRLGLPVADAAASSFTELHRALLSLREKLEAIDGYAHRAEVCTDEAERLVIEHDRDEAVEHATILLEWIRRYTPVFDTSIRRYLSISDSIVAATESDAISD